MSEWVLTSIGDITDNYDGQRIPVKGLERKTGPYPYYGASGIIDYVADYIFEGEYLLIAEDGENLKTRNTPIAFIAEGKFWVNNHAHVIKGKEKALTRFLLYAITNLDIAPYLTGSTFPKLTKTNLNRIELSIPPMNEQYAIAHILGTLDNKIELNRRMNETLESIARALFKSWFIDFDPVCAKAEGKQLFGMDEETAAMFPSEFEDSNLGMMPMGWSVFTLEESITAEKGLSYKGDFLSENDGVPMHNLNSVYEGGGYKYEGIKHYTGEYKTRHKLSAGDIIVTNTEQGFDYLLIGYPAIVPKWFGCSGIFSHHIFRVQPKPDSTLKTHFLYYLLMAPLVREQIIACTNGTTVNMLSIDGLKMPRFILPPPELIEQFEKIAVPIFEKMEAIHEESQTLASMRDTLLPKLISGEVSVPIATSFKLEDDNQPSF